MWRVQYNIWNALKKSRRIISFFDIFIVHGASIEYQTVNTFLNLKKHETRKVCFNQKFPTNQPYFVMLYLIVVIISDDVKSFLWWHRNSSNYQATSGRQQHTDLSPPAPNCHNTILARGELRSVIVGSTNKTI